MISIPVAIAGMLIVCIAENGKRPQYRLNPIFFTHTKPHPMNTNEELKGNACRAVASPRREFLRKGALFGTLAGVTGVSMISSCGTKMEDDEISPAEDLMREHGVFNRIMMIYDNCMSKMARNEEFRVDVIKNSASIIRSFIEDYHEMLEEKFLFPRFVNANIMVDLVQTLYIQHHAGRILTDQILNLAVVNTFKNPVDTLKLNDLLNTFNRMYRPHEAREDSVLFPEIRKIVTRNEYASMGEDFEKQEHKLFGSDGFEGIVDKVATIEKQLGIYDISAFTPAV